LEEGEIDAIEDRPEDAEGYRPTNLGEAIGLLMSNPPEDGEVLHLRAHRTVVGGQRQETTFALTDSATGITLETGVVYPHGVQSVVVAGWTSEGTNGHESIDLSEWQGWRYQYAHVGHR
jgi:hypothetical protein